MFCIVPEMQRQRNCFRFAVIAVGSQSPLPTEHRKGLSRNNKLTNQKQHGRWWWRQQRTRARKQSACLFQRMRTYFEWAVVGDERRGWWVLILACMLLPTHDDDKKRRVDPQTTVVKNDCSFRSIHAFKPTMLGHGIQVAGKEDQSINQWRVMNIEWRAFPINSFLDYIFIFFLKRTMQQQQFV